jgi:small membrane protein
VNWIQILVILAVFALLVFLLRARGSVQARAWVKVCYVVFVVAGIYAVLRPNDTTILAHWLGVGRGTDLMLYLLVVAFAYTTLNTYLHFRDVELRYARLARAIALEGAQKPEN